MCSFDYWMSQSDTIISARDASASENNHLKLKILIVLSDTLVRSMLNLHPRRNVLRTWKIFFLCLGSSNGPHHPVELSEDGEILTSMSSGLSWKSENKNRNVHKDNFIKITSSKFFVSPNSSLASLASSSSVRRFSWYEKAMLDQQDMQVQVHFQVQLKILKYFINLCPSSHRVQALLTWGCTEHTSQMKPPKTIHL